ncbi:uncharacterized protein C8R40DRAFT_1178864 [Lentinula edodes]|uniref:uncharacterized protein n=1 Tax=Lentinula edodes TaxID=5353 RepID=UPI001E8EC3F4|nr:uncharacterized protein C8R40DRAFT_1178864 [Lentinula edodes]KAH7867659.1 hypothetical protein C8R40DRAFT_1178864 [Lentinula edodes]
MHDEAKNENNRSFVLKRERKQLRRFQGLIHKEPLTKSTFCQAVSSSSDVDLKQKKASPPAVPPPPSRIPSLCSVSPVRPSLATKKMHGPRLSSTKWEWHKTEESGKVFESDRDDNYGNTAEDDVDFFGVEEQLELDADTSITGFVGKIFAGSHQTSTPPQHHLNELPPGLETKDGIPPVVSKLFNVIWSDPFAMPNLQDKSLSIGAGNSMQDDSIMPATTIPVAPFLLTSPALSSSPEVDDPQLFSWPQHAALFH